MCGPIAAVAGFFRETLEEADYIRMRYKNVLVNTQGELLLIVVDLKKHRSREHVRGYAKCCWRGTGVRGTGWSCWIQLERTLNIWSDQGFVVKSA